MPVFPALLGPAWNMLSLHTRRGEGMGSVAAWSAWAARGPGFVLTPGCTGVYPQQVLGACALSVAVRREKGTLLQGVLGGAWAEGQTVQRGPGTSNQRISEGFLKEAGSCWALTGRTWPCEGGTKGAKTCYSEEEAGTHEQRGFVRLKIQKGRGCS